MFKVFFFAPAQNAIPTGSSYFKLLDNNGMRWSIHVFLFACFVFCFCCLLCVLGCFPTLLLEVFGRSKKLVDDQERRFLDTSWILSLWRCFFFSLLQLTASTQLLRLLNCLLRWNFCLLGTGTCIIIIIIILIFFFGPTREMWFLCALEDENVVGM